MASRKCAKSVLLIWMHLILCSLAEGPQNQKDIEVRSSASSVASIITDFSNFIQHAKTSTSVNPFCNTKTRRWNSPTAINTPAFDSFLNTSPESSNMVSSDARSGIQTETGSQIHDLTEDETATPGISNTTATTQAVTEPGNAMNKKEKINEPQRASRTKPANLNNPGDSFTRGNFTYPQSPPGSSISLKPTISEVTAKSSQQQSFTGSSPNQADPTSITAASNNQINSTQNSISDKVNNSPPDSLVADDRITLNIIGLFAMTGTYPAGESYLPAALLAVKHINSREDILQGYKLQINAHDTACNESLGLDAFYSEVYNPNRNSIMTLGATCSHVTEATAQVSALWGLLQVSYSALSPHLSNKAIFPYFYRVMTPEQNLTVGRVKLFNETGWRRVHIIYQNFKLFSTLDEYMKQDLKREGIQVVSTEMFTDDPTPSVENLRRNDSRIIIVSMYENKAREVMCAAYNLETEEDRSRAWYKRVVWILPSFYDRFWMHRTSPNETCTTDHLLEVLGNYFTVGSPPYVKTKGYEAVTGTTPTAFYKSMKKYVLRKEVVKEIPPKFRKIYENSSARELPLFGQHRAPEAYDAVWAIAFALNNSLARLGNVGLQNFTYRNKTFTNILQAGMKDVSFKALSGPFSFNQQGDRTPGVEISRYNNGDVKDNDHRYAELGSCHLAGSGGHWECSLDMSRIRWEAGRPPVDGIQTKMRPLRIDCRLVYTSLALACVGILLTTLLLVFNIVKRDHRVIKMSSPRLNNIILVGCMLAYSTILLLDVAAPFSCVLRTFTIVLSFSLSFGALFAKTWRVYKIFTAGHRVLNTRMLRDSTLFVIVAVVVFINSMLLVSWLVVSPQTPTLVNISRTPAGEMSDTQYINQFHRCDSKYRLQFTCALLAIQSVVILLGTFLAIQTRKVSCPELNDSKWIAMCIYNVVVLCPVAVVVVMATEDKPEMNYALEVAMLLLITTMTQCLIFVPKIIAYRKHNRCQTTNLNIKLKLRQMNNVFNFFYVDRKFSKAAGSGSFRPEDISTCCEASQQTDDLDNASLTKCTCSSSKLPRDGMVSFCLGYDDEGNPDVKTNDPSEDIRGVVVDVDPVSFVEDQLQTQCPDSGIGNYHEHTSCGTAMKRSRSEPSFCCSTPLKWSTPEKTPVTGRLSHGIMEPVKETQTNQDITDQSHCKIKRWSEAVPVDKESIFRCQNSRETGPIRCAAFHDAVLHKYDKESIPFKEKNLKRSGTSMSVRGTRCDQGDTAAQGSDTVKVKADLKVSSRIGFKASWREGQGNNLNQTQQVFELLSRLRAAVNAESGGTNV